MDFSWKYILYFIDPIALSVGPFQIYWYSLFFLGGWYLALQAVLFFEKKNRVEPILTPQKIEMLFWVLLLGAVIGGRLGYALFYTRTLFFGDPLFWLIPYDFEQRVFRPFQGMSFHGGLIGIAVALYWWSKKEKINFFVLTDRLVIGAPIVVFFGRLGNFFNHEIIGRITTSNWGIYFPPEQFLRHPTAIYSAFFEGLLLFAWLFYWKKRFIQTGSLTLMYLFSAAFVRFMLEFWRQPDSGIELTLSFLSRGQVLSLGLFLSVFCIWFLRLKYVKISTV